MYVRLASAAMTIGGGQGPPRMASSSLKSQCAELTKLLTELGDGSALRREMKTVVVTWAVCAGLPLVTLLLFCTVSALKRKFCLCPLVLPIALIPAIIVAGFVHSYVTGRSVSTASRFRPRCSADKHAKFEGACENACQILLKKHFKCSFNHSSFVRFVRNVWFIFVGTFCQDVSRSHRGCFAACLVLLVGLYQCCGNMFLCNAPPGIYCCCLEKYRGRRSIFV